MVKFLNFSHNFVFSKIDRLWGIVCQKHSNYKIFCSVFFNFQKNVSTNFRQIIIIGFNITVNFQNFFFFSVEIFAIFGKNPFFSWSAQLGIYILKFGGKTPNIHILFVFCFFSRKKSSYRRCFVNNLVFFISCIFQ